MSSSNSSNNNFYGSSAPTKRKPAPKPPPRKPTTARTTNPKMASRSTYQSNRAVPPSKPSSGNAPKINRTSKPSSGNAPPSRTSMRSSTAGTMRARKAPAASRPVGSYYNSTATNESTTASATMTTTSFSNLYAAPAPVSATTTSSDDDTWDDWGTPTKTTTTTAASNPASSWAAPAPAASTNDWAAPAPVAAATTNQWVAPAPAASSSTTTDWYSSSSTTTTTASASAYTSSGFGNQPQQQQQPSTMQPGTGFFQTNTTSQQPSGAMDTSAPMMNSTTSAAAAAPTANPPAPAGAFDLGAFSTFIPSSMMTPQQTPQGPNDSTYPSIEDEAPLLEELGINITHMMLKSKAVAFPFSRFGGDQIDPAVICQDGELVGPVCLLLALGGEMVLTGKLQFGYIYIYGLFGCIAMTFVVNLISPTESISFWTVTSIMGYALLPVNILALVKIVVVNLINLQTLGNILGTLTVLWSTLASTRLLELGCHLRDQRYLILYPLLLFYSAFVMMTIL